MAIRKIRLKDDELLRKKSRKVEKITPTIETLVADMADTMYESNGVGLAAPQVGVLRRIVVIDVGEELFEMINPEIISTEGEQTDSEGCLSVPGESAQVTRPQKVKVRYMDLKGEEYELEGEGLLARAICHEVDHLEGILYIDKAIPNTRKTEKQAEEGSLQDRINKMNN